MLEGKGKAVWISDETGKALKLWAVETDQKMGYLADMAIRYALNQRKTGALAAMDLK